MHDSLAIHKFELSVKYAANTKWLIECSISFTW